MAENICFVDSMGEKAEEALPDGAYRVPGIPLFLAPPVKVEAKLIWEEINKLLALSTDIKHREDVLKIIESIRAAANGRFVQDERNETAGETITKAAIGRKSLNM
jgi:hypothetical protein